jgi:hypothetical protein
VSPAARSERAVRAPRELVPRRAVAVDWSGSLASVRAHLWLAEAGPPGLTRLECGYDRDELVLHLVELAAEDPRLVVGLDFAFSFPRWHLRQLGVGSGRELWDRAACDGERWLERCEPPFWGKVGRPRPRSPEGCSPYRATESEELPVGGIGPKSVFQVGGAGTVGTGSIRGMPYLARLQDAGFAIWPFDRARLPLVVEIYPRYLTGPVDKSSRVARELYLEAHHAREPRQLLARAGKSQDAFDAAVSAVAMHRCAADFARLARRRRSALDRLEGRIWRPLRDPLGSRGANARP